MLVAACGGSDDEDAPRSPTGETTSQSSSGVGGGGGTAEGGGGAAPTGPIEIPPSEGSVELAFDPTVTGDGSLFVGAIDMTSGSGTVEVDGNVLPALIYERQPFDPWLLFQALVVAPDRWYVLWFYCQGDALEYIYFEGTDGTAIDYELANGSCVDGAGPVTANVSFPAVSMPIPPLLDGFTLEGAMLHLDGATPGSVDLDGPNTLLAFEHVDCTVDCGAPGWREIHSILWQPEAEKASFGIFYLFDDSTQIPFTYAITLPDLTDPGDVDFEARWSYTP
jgi:hypothetical protein